MAQAVPLFQLRTGALFDKREPKPSAASIARVQFTDFYCQSGGSNLNGGSDTGNAAKYTSTNGNWSTVTNQFIPTDASIPYGQFKVGDFASVYVDGATVAVYIALVIGVAPGANGAITLSSTLAAGSAPTTSATARTIKVGGAHLGPNAASGFPFTLTNIGNLRDAGSHQVRFNLKNDASYSITAAFSVDSNSANAIIIQGYSSSPGDGGRATIDGGTSTAGLLGAPGSSNNIFIDLVFTTSISSGATNMVNVAVLSQWVRCVFVGARGFGLNFTVVGCSAIECEFYNCNRANTSASGALNLNSGLASRCVIHGNTGSNASGIVIPAGPAVVEFCVFDGNGQYGINITTATNQGLIRIANNDFYRNTADAIRTVSTQLNPFWIENNNFIQNGSGINNAGTGTGFSYNNGYSDNRSGDVLGNIFEPYGKIVYPSGVTPWKDPDNGDFSIVLSSAIGVGRGAFTETQSYSSPNTIGYPDIGSAQAQSITQSFSTTGTQTLPYGYLNHYYAWKWSFSAPTIVTLLSGTLPPGILLVQASPTAIYLLGTPTTIGAYDFTLRSTVGTSTGDALFEITVYDDPDEGVGGVGGG